MSASAQLSVSSAETRAAGGTPECIIVANPGQQVQCDQPVDKATRWYLHVSGNQATDYTIEPRLIKAADGTLTPPGSEGTGGVVNPAENSAGGNSDKPAVTTPPDVSQTPDTPQPTGNGLITTSSGGLLSPLVVMMLLMMLMSRWFTLGFVAGSFKRVRIRPWPGIAPLPG